MLIGNLYKSLKTLIEKSLSPMREELERGERRRGWGETEQRGFCG